MIFHNHIISYITINQLLKNQSRRVKKQRCMVPALIKCPQKLGSVIRVFEQAPKKPNSARRKVARVKIKHTGRLITCHIPGEGHNLSKHSTVLIRGGRCQDLIGVRYKPIRGKESFAALNSRVTRLSKYGVKKKPRFIEFRELQSKMMEEYNKKLLLKFKKTFQLKFKLLKQQQKYLKYFKQILFFSRKISKRNI